MSVLDAAVDREVTRIKRHRARTDLYYLLTRLLGRADMASNRWLRARCEEVQRAPDGMLDLWAREHYKSTIITFGLTIQTILACHGEDAIGPEKTIGIFSHTRPIAKAFLRQIKSEFERNESLKRLFPDVLYDDPRTQAPKWSEDEGILVKRKGNPKEATVEAWGLVDGQPTSKHFDVLVYDDVVTRESVTTPEMIAKTISALELSYNLGTRDGVRRFVGTRYHANDAYRTIMDRGTVMPRLHPATVDGTVDGEPVLLPADVLAERRRSMGPYTFGSQMLLNPIADETQGFRVEWMRYYDIRPADRATTRVMVVDPAGGKRKNNDYTSVFVVALGQDRNYYVVDMIRDRMNLTERVRVVIELHRKWKPREVRYERVGMQADVEYLRTVQDAESYRFDVTEVGASMPKNDRIRRLVPLFETGRIYFPRSHHRTDYEGRTRDLVHDFIEDEFRSFPVSAHDDMLDALSRIADPDHPLAWPMEDARPQTLKFKTLWGA